MWSRRGPGMENERMGMMEDREGEKSRDVL